MGRKSSLSVDQWADVERRYVVNGESICALAKEYGVNESSIRRKLKEKEGYQDGMREELTHLASRKVKAEREIMKVNSEIESLPVVRQMIVSDLAAKLAAVSNHVASTAEYMSATSHKLAAIANSLMDKVDDAEPMKSTETLQQAAAIIRLSNDAAQTPMNLLKANQSTIDAMNKVNSEEVPAGLEHFYGG